MTPSEITLLQTLAKGKRFIECGACVGGSTVPLAQVAAHVISIDRHKDYGPTTLGLFLRNTAEYVARISTVIGDCRSALPAQVGEAALIDLLGTFESTYSALCLMPKMVNYVAIHDVGRAHCEGVDRAIKAAKGWHPVAQADTLVVLGRDI